MKAQDRHQNAGPEFGEELAGTTVGEQASPHDPIEGETSWEKAQASVIPQPEEPIIRGSTEQCKELRAEASMIGVRVCERKREREEVTLMNTKRNGG